MWKAFLSFEIGGNFRNREATYSGFYDEESREKSSEVL
jgi:hypothetical protein